MIDTNDLFKYLTKIQEMQISSDVTPQVAVSSACNLKCPQCSSHIEGHHTGFFSKVLWDERIKPILGQLKEIHLVGIGEPMLHRDFFTFVEDAVCHGVAVHTTSNLQGKRSLSGEY